MDLSGLTGDVFRSTDEIVKRIFNHRPFLEAELQTMVRNFDFDERDELQEIHRKIVHIKDQSFNEIENRCQPLEKANLHVDKLEKLIDQILDSESANESERKNRLSQYTAQKSEDLIKFMEQINSQIDNIDNSYMNAKKEIDIKYKNIKK
ncbi:uncharacterized protein LOC113792031 [Dermatophagoides pteronyssinus]|uniref:uncharacterized protein LOC113792031 n=1 Tax=Dermatophagoides pteronyssinus TaxID=6956 RepID=UPI003F670EC6